MKKLAVFLFLISFPARAVWLPDLYGHPPAAYFSAANSKLLDWGLQRAEREGEKISAPARNFLRACVKETRAWWIAENAGTRTPQFFLRLEWHEGKQHYSFFCRPAEWNRNLRRLRAKFLGGEKIPFPIAGVAGLGVSATGPILYNGKSFYRRSQNAWRAETYRAFIPRGKWPEGLIFPFPHLLEAYQPVFSEGQRIGYVLELKGYVDSLAPEPLRRKIAAVHEEFGFLADTIYWDSKGGREVYFP